MIEQEDIDHATGYIVGLMIDEVRKDVKRMLSEGYTVEQIKLEARETRKEILGCLTSQ